MDLSLGYLKFLSPDFSSENSEAPVEYSYQPKAGALPG